MARMTKAQARDITLERKRRRLEKYGTPRPSQSVTEAFAQRPLPETLAS